jgi:hypothetical protein
VEKTKTSNKPNNEEVLREFPPLGKYRIRLVRNPRRPGEAPTLDIREYISSETFEGFTRRGIRLGDRAQMDLLRDVLKEILEAGGFAKPAPGLLPAQ